MGSFKLVHGVGVNDWHSKVRVNGKMIPEYQLWANMLYRGVKAEGGAFYPTYVGVTVDYMWYSLTAFINDVSTLVGYEKALTEGWHLDKDILNKGNKHYSLKTCCFVPNSINSLIISCSASRGKYPVGVCFNKIKSKFVAQITYEGKTTGLGYYNTPEEAFQAYKTAKEKHIKLIAEKYKDLIDCKVYQALLSWEITIKD